MKTRLRALSPICLALAAGIPAAADVNPHAGMLRFPDVSASHIVFSYANDLWIVGRDGGVASPLASPPGGETFPRFSNDGKTIAFVGNYDGGRDIYTIGVSGGVPARVTHHPVGENLCDWSPDGTSLLYLSNAFAGLGRQSQLFLQPAAGGMFTRLPVPYAGFGSLSPDSKWLAYTLHSTDTRTWKRYRGGMATDVWLFNLETKASKMITNWEGTDTLPMWVPGGDGSVVYYLSDNGPEHRLNIWAYDLKADRREQVTFFKTDDVRWPSVGPGPAGKGEIIFQLGSQLMLLDLGTRQAKDVKVTIPGDRPKIRERTVDASRNIQGMALGPAAKRVLVQARGDLWSVPAKDGVQRNLTRTDGINERDPAWSSDGKWLAYLSDESGEYELWVRPSDARAPEEKKDAKKDGGEAKEGQPEKPEAGSSAPVAPRKLTSIGAGYRTNVDWSPNSKWITMTDQGGRLFLVNAETGETKELDKDPWMNGISVSWSHDSAWLTYARADDRSNVGVVWVVNVKSGEKHRVTAGMFSAGSPVFDRKGDWLFYHQSSAVNNPVYSDLDTTYAYTNSDVIVAVPLRKDVKNPWLPENDEETLKKDEKKKEEAKKPEGAKDEKKDAKPADAPAADDPISGTWAGTAKGSSPQMAAGIPVTLNLKLADGKVTGSITSLMGGGQLDGTFDKASGKLTLTANIGGMSVVIDATLAGAQVTGTWTAGDQTGEFTASRKAGGEEPKAAEGDKPEDKKDDKKELKIDFDGIESRSIQLPIAPGNFGQMAVSDGDRLIFARRSSRGGVEGGIRVFDYKTREGKEEGVTAGGGFQLSADGKKLLVGRGGSAVIVDATAGGGRAQTVSPSGLNVTINPRNEWRQIFTDAWRITRDYFYEPTMHGVDWEGIKAHYGAMLDDISSREDLNWIISEMISELNVGHAYLGNPGDVEGQPTVGGGLLGVDFELATEGDNSAYRFAKIYAGGPWDADARGPLSTFGVGIKEGEFLLAVNGVPVDTRKDPYAAFIATAGRTVSLTVGPKPTLEGSREVLVTPIGSEAEVRYRHHIESKRAYVAEKSGGKIGYIYVPNTGVDGQNDLYRQYFGQRGAEALIIDERWNGGGQIPTRFIELLNRKPTNYWARRDGNDWPWPPDAFFGPKAMLVNGLAGSGGDMFPWLFKYNKLGKVIGTRTWGGLVGISGNPAFMDGGSITVPTFGFYETDGTWGVEGHGTDPDIVVVDDPALMWNGGDPQLDAAIEHLQSELKTNPYVSPKRPASPNRKGMGIDEKDK